MLGAIAGDIIGSRFEFRARPPRYDFELFGAQSRPTDDTIMTVAVTEALLTHEGADEEEVRRELVWSMRAWGRSYPRAGYGHLFWDWLTSDNPQPYGSFGNGSAMRVSPVGWLSQTLDETRRIARLTASVSHDHPEGLKGAEAVAAAIFLTRGGATRDEVAAYVTDAFGYDLMRSTDTLRALREGFDATCQRTVPAAIRCYLEGEDFEDVVRKAVSLGGDTDTIAAIAGSVAEAAFGVPREIEVECLRRLPHDARAVFEHFRARVGRA